MLKIPSQRHSSADIVGNFGPVSRNTYSSYACTENVVLALSDELYPPWNQKGIVMSLLLVFAENLKKAWFKILSIWTKEASSKSRGSESSVRPAIAWLTSALLAPKAVLSLGTITISLMLRPKVDLHGDSLHLSHLSSVPFVAPIQVQQAFRGVDGSIAKRLRDLRN